MRRSSVCTLAHLSWRAEQSLAPGTATSMQGSMIVTAMCPHVHPFGKPFRSLPAKSPSYWQGRSLCPLLIIQTTLHCTNTLRSPLILCLHPTRALPPPHPILPWEGPRPCPLMLGTKLAGTGEWSRPPHMGLSSVLYNLLFPSDLTILVPASPHSPLQDPTITLPFHFSTDSRLQAFQTVPRPPWVTLLPQALRKTVYWVSTQQWCTTHRGFGPLHRFQKPWRKNTGPFRMQVFCINRSVTTVRE